MPKVPMIATKAFTYNTRRLKADDDFEARNPLDARILERVRGVAQPAAPAPSPAPEVIPTVEEVLKAEVVEEEQPSPQPAPKPAARKARARRRIKATK